MQLVQRLFVSFYCRSHIFSTFSCHTGFFFCLFACLTVSIGWAARNDAIWLTSCSLSMVAMATVSSEWGHGSNWPIVSKLHFSEWFPQSCYWNRAPALWWIHLVIHSLKGGRWRVQTWHRGGLALLKQRGNWMKTTQQHKYGAKRNLCFACSAPIGFGKRW